MTQLVEDSKTSERKNKFKYLNNKITTVIKLMQDPSGNWREISKEDGPEIPTYEETITYIKPYWDLANYVESKATYSGPLDIAKFKIDTAILSRLQLLYYLKTCSLIDLKLQKDTQGFEYISNIDEFLGENGLHPSIINILIEKIRS